MDKPDGDNFKKKGFIDLKEYEKKQIEKKNQAELDELDAMGYNRRNKQNEC